MKKRGFGKGNWNGVGGKVEAGESVESAARRETAEEIGVSVSRLTQIALLDFYFDDPTQKAWNQRVHVFTCDIWSGDPVETEEMAPQWFDINHIPYEQMWDDDPYWLPPVLEGTYVTAEFHFDVNSKVTAHTIHAVQRS